MKKTLKKLAITVLALLLSTSSISAYAAGYDVIKEPWLESNFYEYSNPAYEDFSPYVEQFSPSMFINGKSTVFADLWTCPGMYVEYYALSGFCEADESGNLSELNPNIFESGWTYYDEADAEEGNVYASVLKIPSWDFEYEEYGFKAEIFNSQKYFGKTSVIFSEEVMPGDGGGDRYAYINGLAVATNVEDWYDEEIDDWHLGLCGIIDKNDNIIVPFIYDSILPVGTNGYTWVLKDNKWGIIKVSNSNVAVTVNGTLLTFDQNPLVINGRTLAPVRAIFEALGATVEWKNDTREVISTKGDITITMAIDNTTMYKNGTPITLDVAPQIIGERTLVPVRAIAEAFNCKVEWDNDTQTVIITD